jgi:hypothetical protein
MYPEATYRLSSASVSPPVENKNLSSKEIDAPIGPRSERAGELNHSREARLPESAAQLEKEQR